MSEWSLKYLTTLKFTSANVDYPVRSSVYNAWGWPEEPERSSRTIIFTNDNVYGAYLFSPKDVILFSVARNKNVVEPR
jgi:hypothetical protein